jgi:peptidase E
MSDRHEGHIVAFGGGGFSESPNAPLEDFVLSLARRQPARVCFIGTASGDAASYIAKFYRAFSRRCVPDDLTLIESTTLTRRPTRTADLAAFVAEQDVFYVGGGNTANLLATWRTHGLDVLLRDAWRSGAVMTGVSAGMICWFQASVTDSFGDLAPLHDGLGFLEGSACPHYDDEPGRRPLYHELVRAGFPGGYAAESGVGLHFVGTSFREAVSAREDGGAFRVQLDDAQVVEHRIPVRQLGTP